MTEPVLDVRGLKKHFPVRKGLLSRVSSLVHAVDGVSFTVGQGETLGLVGESGCGKSTVGKLILRLIDPTDGEITLSGARIDGLSREAMRLHRQDLQVVFQDPYSSLNPRMRAADIVAEPLRNFARGSAREIKDRVADHIGLRRHRAIARRRALDLADGFLDLVGLLWCQPQVELGARFGHGPLYALLDCL